MLCIMEIRTLFHSGRRCQKTSHVLIWVSTFCDSWWACSNVCLWETWVCMCIGQVPQVKLKLPASLQPRTQLKDSMNGSVTVHFSMTCSVPTVNLAFPWCFRVASLEATNAAIPPSPNSSKQQTDDILYLISCANPSNYVASTPKYHSLYLE